MGFSAGRASGGEFEDDSVQVCKTLQGAHNGSFAIDATQLAFFMFVKAHNIPVLIRVFNTGAANPRNTCRIFYSQSCFDGANCRASPNGVPVEE